MLGVVKNENDLGDCNAGFMQNKLKPSLLTFHFVLFFFALPLNFFKKLPHWKERKKNRSILLFAFLIKN